MEIIIFKTNNLLYCTNYLWQTCETTKYCDDVFFPYIFDNDDMICYA